MMRDEEVEEEEEDRNEGADLESRCGVGRVRW